MKSWITLRKSSNIFWQSSRSKEFGLHNFWSLIKLPTIKLSKLMLKYRILTQFTKASKRRLRTRSCKCRKMVFLVRIKLKSYTDWKRSNTTFSISLEWSRKGKNSLGIVKQGQMKMRSKIPNKMNKLVDTNFEPITTTH